MIQPLWLHEVLNSYATVSSGQKVLRQLALHSPDEDGFYLVDGIIWKKGKIWVGANEALQTKLIRALHASALGGHSGIQTIFQRIHKLFAWSGFKRDVTEFVQQCS